MKHVAICLLLLFARGAALADAWQDLSYRKILRNDSIEASFQAGQLFELKNLATGRMLISADPREMPANIPLFGSVRFDLGTCHVTQQSSENNDSLQVILSAKDGTEWTLH